MKKVISQNCKKIVIIIFLAIFLLLVLFGISYWISDNAALLSIYTLTFFALIWYAFETQGMKRVIKDQNELSNMPVLFLYPKSKDSHQYIKLRNIGGGIAFNISIRNIHFTDDEIPIKIKTTNKNHYDYRTIIPKDEAYIEFGYANSSTFLDNRNLPSDKPTLLSRILSDVIQDLFIIQYRDLKNNKYRIELKKEGHKSFIFIRLLKNGKVIKGN